MKSEGDRLRSPWPLRSRLCQSWRLATRSVAMGRRNSSASPLVTADELAGKPMPLFSEALSLA